MKRDIINKNISTLSPGLDPVQKRFIEVSATPLPAIIGPGIKFSSSDSPIEIILFENSVFDELASDNKDINKAQENLSVKRTKAFSFEELKKQKMDVTSIKSKYSKISDDLFEVLFNLFSASEEELQGINPIEASYDAIGEFIFGLEELFELSQ